MTSIVRALKAVLTCGALVCLTGALLSACDRQAAPGAETPDAASSAQTVDAPGDWIYGFNESQRFFAFREYTRIGDEAVYTLRMTFAGYNRVPDQSRDELRLSSASIDASQTDVNTRDAMTRARFSEQAEQLLTTYRFPAKPVLGTCLFDSGSFVQRFGKEPLPEQQSQTLKLMGGAPMRLVASTRLRQQEIAGEKPLREAALALALVGASDGGAALDAANTRDLLREPVWQAGISGYWLRAGYLSPDGQKLVLLVESYADESGAPQPGRQALFTVGVNLRAIAAPGKDGLKAAQPGAPDHKFILSPAKPRPQTTPDPAQNRTVKP